MADDLTPMFLAMAFLAKNAALKSDVATSWWGTVAAVSGDTVSVILESDTSLSAREVTVNATGPCLVGDEVLLQMQGRDLTIVANKTAQTRLAAAPVIATGSVSITPTAANAPTSADITFPTGRFSVAPVVQVTAATSVPGSQVTGVGVTNVTSTGCRVFVTRINTTATPVNWTAVQA